MRDLQHDLLVAADALGATAGHDDYVATAAETMRWLLPADRVFWTASAFDHHRMTVLGDPVMAAHADDLGRWGHTHPGVGSYDRRPSDLSPRRLSDVCSLSTWHRTALFAEVFRSLDGDHQLSVMLDLAPPSSAVCWVLTRSRRDFDEDDLAVARGLQPLLRMAERRHAGTRPVLAARPDGPTPRERQVLTLLDQGLTAAAIARRCDVTTRAVRKHLEHLYAKLGCHDRLVAVHRARERGWLPPV